MPTANPNKERDDAYKRRIDRMRNDRNDKAPFINEFYRLSQKWAERVGAKTTPKPTEDEIADELDSTLTETVDDYASDMIAQFTPAYEPWVKHEPTKALNTEQRRQVESQIKNAVDWLWDDIQESTYYDAADECFHELANGTMAVRRRDFGAAQPIVYEPIPIANLLIDKGPDGSADGRFSEGSISKLDFKVHYGRWATLPVELKLQFDRAKDDQCFSVCDGVCRVWDVPGTVRWRRVVMLENKLVYERIFNEDGAEDVYVSRWRTRSKSAYGIGAGWRAMAPQRVLNELHALVLAQMHNVVDPSHAYSDPDGSANLEQGIGAGDWLQLGEGFAIEKLSGDGEFNAAFYKTEDLRMMIKHALYQDKPEQRGDTPPTATQWADESARAQQRFEIPRGKIIREWVVPIVRGHQWLRTQHGRFPQVKLGSDAIMLQPQSPAAKSRSFEKVSKAERVLVTAQSPVLMQGAQLVIDPQKTISNIKSEIGDDLIAIRTEDEVKALMAQAAQMAQQDGAGAEGAA